MVWHAGEGTASQQKDSGGHGAGNRDKAAPSWGQQAKCMQEAPKASMGQERVRERGTGTVQAAGFGRGALGSVGREDAVCGPG